MMEKQGKSEYNMGWQKTLVFQSRKPVVKFQQTHSILDFFHFNHRPRVQMFKRFDLNRRNPRNRIDTILISFIKRSILRGIKRFRFNLHSSHQFHKSKIQLVRDYLSTRDDLIFWVNSCVKKKKKSLSKSSNVARFFFSTINMINGPFSTFTFTSFESSRFKRHGGSFKKTTKI